MAQEIERKFLVSNLSWRSQSTRLLYRQGYIPTENRATVRVRVAGDKGYLTLKGPSTGITRLEFEYAIPVTEADVLLTQLCTPPLIEKWRYRLIVGNHQWEVDEFLGDNAGLILAEVELASEDEPFVMPAWVGQEVSQDPRYYNSNLAKNPYGQWTQY